MKMKKDKSKNERKNEFFSVISSMNFRKQRQFHTFGFIKKKKKLQLNEEIDQTFILYFVLFFLNKNDFFFIDSLLFDYN
jgi:hypothetical protein